VRIGLAVAALLTAALPAFAQRGNDGSPHLEVIVVPPASAFNSVSVRAGRFLGDAKTRELLVHGFPAALRFRLELWRVGGLFDDLEAATTWQVLVRYEPYTRQYSVVRLQSRSTENLGGFATLEETEAELAKPYPVALPPKRPGARYYYNVVLDQETLSVSDLDELQRWLQGDLQPVVRGRRDPFTALRRGFGTLLSRVLGGTKRHYEARSGTFRA
jgi:hypothetical protein